MRNDGVEVLEGVTVRVGNAQQRVQALSLGRGGDGGHAHVAQVVEDGGLRVGVLQRRGANRKRSARLWVNTAPQTTIVVNRGTPTTYT